MKKTLKLVTIFMLLGALILTTLSLTACNKKVDNLTYCKKYIYKSSIGYEDDETKNYSYIIFNKDGTADWYSYTFYDYSYDENYNRIDVCRYYEYTNTYDVKVLDDSSICLLWKSRTYGEKHTEEKSDSTTSTSAYIFAFSKDVVMKTTDADLYICEKYLEENPNFTNVNPEDK